jgi:TRAP-type C4-dicarboxylate transport system permease small subunit
MLATLAKLHDGLTRLTFWISAAAVLYVTAATSWEVVGRYAFDAPSDWSPDTSAVAFAYITFLAAPMLTREGGHAAMTFVTETAPRHVSAWLTRFSHFLGAVTCFLCAYVGADETGRQIGRGVMMISVTPIPKWLVSAVIVYGLASMGLYFLRHLFASFRSDATA